MMFLHLGRRCYAVRDALLQTGGIRDPCRQTRIGFLRLRPDAPRCCRLGVFLLLLHAPTGSIKSDPGESRDNELASKFHATGKAFNVLS
jgi:hypothetical protein